MRKAVSKGKYTLFFEDCKDYIDCIAYETGRHIPIEEIANAFGVSVSASRKTLKRSIQKIYSNMKKKHKDMSPCDIVSAMAVIFNINYITEYKQFLRLFPKRIRRELYETARGI
jgi:hypothetical protein